MSRDADLLAKMASDLKLAGKAERTVEAYTAVRRLVRRTGKPLGEIEESDIRQYLLDMVENRVARGTFSINLCGIRFFWMDTMGLDWKIFDLAKPRYDKKLPVVLSRGEVWRILDEVTIPVYRVCLTTIYSCGLRLLEGGTLTVPQIDSARMQLHIHGKGGRDRYVPLPERTLLMLRGFWRTHRAPILLFPATTRKGLKHSLETEAGPIHRSSLQGAFRRARDKAGIRKKAHIHTLRRRDGRGCQAPTLSRRRSWSQAPFPRSVEDTRTWPRTDVPSQIDVGKERLAVRNAFRAHHRLRGHSRPPATGASVSAACDPVAG